MADDGFEPSDVAIRPVGLVIFGMFVAAVVVGGMVGGLLLLLQAGLPRPVTTAVERAALPPPQPALQAAPADDLARLRAAETQQLDGLGWVDQKAGIVHIPIERAQQLLIERGWPEPKGAPP